MLLLRHCHVPRLNNLARTVLPRLLQQACEVHDFLTRSSFQNIIESVAISNWKWHQATLPIPCGGIGLSPSARILPLAFVSSWAHSLHALPERFHDLEESVNKLLLDPDSMGSIGHDLHETVPKGQSLSDLINDNVKVQQRLTQKQLRADVD